MKPLCLATCCVALVAGGPAAAVPLDGLIEFSDANVCAPSENFDRLLTTVLRAPGDFTVRAGHPVVPLRYRAAFGKPHLVHQREGTEITLPLNGTWRGLPTIWLRQFAPVGGDTPSFTIRFAAPYGKVRAALNAAHLAIPASGERVNDKDDAYTITIGIHAAGRFTDFYCSWG